jgi:hypothetical protein
MIPQTFVIKAQLYVILLMSMNSDLFIILQTSTVKAQIYIIL